MGWVKRMGWWMVVCAACLAAVGSGQGAAPTALAAVVETGDQAVVGPRCMIDGAAIDQDRVAGELAIDREWTREPAATDGASANDADEVFAATAEVIRPATSDEADTFGARALTSVELVAARGRLAPLVIDTSQPRFVGTTVGFVGVYFPIRGAVDGPASQYALWFDAASGTVWSEAEFIHDVGGVRVRMVIGGEEVLDSLIDGAGPPSGGDFWECFRWCLGASLSHEVYAIFRAVCGRMCFPVPSFFCDKCMIALGVLEAGMISGCTYDCSKNR